VKTSRIRDLAGGVTNSIRGQQRQAQRFRQAHGRLIALLFF